MPANISPNLPMHYQPGFLDEGRATGLLEDLREHLAWREERIRMYGRECKVPRLVAWCGAKGLDYRYSGVCHSCSGWYRPLDDLRAGLSQYLGSEFNFVLANRYRSGTDHMGWHSDDEPELGPRPIIASLSLGGTRRFRVRSQSGGDGSLGFDLEHGSLLVAWGNSQLDYQHCITKTRRPVSERINLTFRWVGQ